MLRNILMILSIILALTGIFISLKSHSDKIIFNYNYDKYSNPEYINVTDDYLLLTTTNTLNKKSSLHLFDKTNWKQISIIPLNKVLAKPEIVDNYIIVATEDVYNKKVSDIQVIDAIGPNLLWKDKVLSKNWFYKAYDDSVLYIDKDGILQNVKTSTREPIWKAAFGNSFEFSTPPEIANGRFFICNNNQILAIDLKSSQIVHNFKTYDNITSCSFHNEKACLLLHNDDILSVDLSRSLILWRYRYVTMLSDSILKIVNNSYLLLLNSTNYTSLRGSNRSKLLNSYHQIFHLINLQSGQTKWQKSVQYPQYISGLISHISKNIIVFKSQYNELLATEVSTGNNIWKLKPGSLYNSYSTFTLSGNYLYLLMNRSKDSFLGILDLYTGRMRNRLTLSNCLTPPLAPVIEDNKAYVACKNSKLLILKIDTNFISAQKKD